MRIFIAIRLTEAFKASILDAQEGLKEQGIRGNFTRPENLHLTLAFIGETDRIDDIKAAVASVRFDPFVITTGQLGCFNGRSRVLWMGIQGKEKMKTLALRLRKALDERGINYSHGPFQPHITLVRQPTETPLDIEVEDACMTIRDIVIMKSERINGRLVYTII